MKNLCVVITILSICQFLASIVCAQENSFEWRSRYLSDLNDFRDIMYKPIHTITSNKQAVQKYNDRVMIPLSRIKEHYELLGFPEKGNTEFRNFKRLDANLEGKKDKNDGQELIGLKYSIKEIRKYIRDASLNINQEYFILNFNSIHSLEYVAIYDNMSGLFQEPHIKPFTAPDNYLAKQLYSYRFYSQGREAFINGNVFVDNSLRGSALLYKGNIGYRPGAQRKSEEDYAFPNKPPLSNMVYLQVDMGRTGSPEREIMLNDLKELAPYFYEQLPEDVTKNSEWYDQNYLKSIIIGKSRRVILYPLDEYKFYDTVEIRGTFDYENHPQGRNFDDYYPDSKYRKLSVVISDMQPACTTKPTFTNDIIIVPNYDSVIDSSIVFSCKPKESTN